MLLRLSFRLIQLRTSAFTAGSLVKTTALLLGRSRRETGAVLPDRSHG
ncbi:hypothetical protein [Streptomyces sp. NRRL S-15]|nr:hypothetical protein [Streptomyces sp. NRRL S-15]